MQTGGARRCWWRSAVFILGFGLCLGNVLAPGQAVAAPDPSEEVEGTFRQVEVRLQPPALETETLQSLRILAKEVRALPIDVPAGGVLESAAYRREGEEGWVALGIARPAEGIQGKELAVFPQPLQSGEKITLRLKARNARGLAGEKLFTPASSEGWFASWSPLTPLPTRLIFHLPSRFQVTVLGQKVKARGPERIAEWSSRQAVGSPVFITGQRQAFFAQRASRDPFDWGDRQGIGASAPSFRYPGEIDRGGAGDGNVPGEASQLADEAREALSLRFFWKEEPSVELLARLATLRAGPSRMLRRFAPLSR